MFITGASNATNVSLPKVVNQKPNEELHVEVAASSEDVAVYGCVDGLVVTIKRGDRATFVATTTQPNPNREPFFATWTHKKDTSQ